MPGATLSAIRSVYLSNGGEFLELPELSRYPRSAFFDTAEHLNETWQIIHSKLVANGLRRFTAEQADATVAGARHVRQ